MHVSISLFGKKDSAAADFYSCRNSFERASTFSLILKQEIMDAPQYHTLKYRVYESDLRKKSAANATVRLQSSIEAIQSLKLIRCISSALIGSLTWPTTVHMLSWRMVTYNPKIWSAVIRGPHSPLIWYLSHSLGQNNMYASKWSCSSIA